MKPAEGNPDMWVPNFGYRYLAEDIPFGLCVTKGLAQLAGVETPETDTVSMSNLSKCVQEAFRERRHLHINDTLFFFYYNLCVLIDWA